MKGSRKAGWWKHPRLLCRLKKGQPGCSGVLESKYTKGVKCVSGNRLPQGLVTLGHWRAAPPRRRGLSADAEMVFQEQPLGPLVN